VRTVAAEDSQQYPPHTHRDLIEVASDVPDLGRVDTVADFLAWCRGWRDWLRRLRIEAGAARSAIDDVGEYQFRYIPEIIYQCKSHLRAFGTTEVPERFAFANVPDNHRIGPGEPMDLFLYWAANGYRSQGRRFLELVEEVSEFLAWSMNKCRDSEGGKADEARASAAPPAGGPAGADDEVNKLSKGKLATVADLAAECRCDECKLRDALRKFARRFPDCREPLEHPKPREDRYIYRREACEPVLHRFRQRANGRTNGRAKNSARQ
jgi:hypothetical protein